ADIGADLVGKVEKGIPEDDPRNPAVIADNVGDNVGDVAGMGADLFESYVDSIIASIAIGIMGVVIAGSDPSFGGKLGLAATLPMLLATLGIMSSLVGIFLVGKGSGEDPHAELNRGMFGASVIFAIAAFIIIYKLMGAAYIGLYWGVLAGLLSGIVIGLTTEYYTSDKYRPTRKLAESSKTGAATNIIEGLALGMLSPAIPVITVSVTILIAYHFAGLYGIALAAVGMLSTLGVTLATDSYGPVADNAAGLAEMAGLGKRTRERAEALDAVGNTTAAIGKGFAIGSAALTALALFTTYTAAAHLSIASFSLSRPDVIVGLFIGGLLPFLFSSMTMQAVGKTAMAMVEEVRRQFKTIRGLMSGKAKPDYARCVEISTHAALKEMIVPSLTAILSPVVVGFLLGPEALGGLLAGAIVSGFVLAIMMANSGGAWDNAKKYIEKGNFGGKGSSPHKAAVVGDTVGDPFKDTSGPSLNILIKLMSIVALVFAPFF
ncbi:MAG TPA: sodium-translocating pyrophosphatase, partial [Euryarchaeota archaeon]|nr:sodium-translocating pyrophosphatase [Euryarchaeota archaeon]